MSSPVTKLDCFRLLADLQQAGVNNSEVARRLGKSRTTVTRWKGGAEPTYSDGLRLIELHAYVTNVADCVRRSVDNPELQP